MIGKISGDIVYNIIRRGVPIRRPPVIIIPDGFAIAYNTAGGNDIICLIGGIYISFYTAPKTWRP